MTSQHKNRFLLINRFLVKLTQNNVLNVDRKPGSANRLETASTGYCKRFRRWGQMGHSIIIQAVNVTHPLRIFLFLNMFQS